MFSSAGSPRGWVPARFAWAPPPAAEDICDVCGGASAPGDALLGCIDACGRLFHFGCLDNPPKRRPRSGALLCPECRAAAPARALKEALKDSPAQKRARKAAPKEARPLSERETLAPPLSEYERERQRNIESNQQKLAELGLEPAVPTNQRALGSSEHLWTDAYTAAPPPSSIMRVCIYPVRVYVTVISCRACREYVSV
ncbi:hypothetical protein EMIHUDRAFT_230450 [Emiliania huxleyi CCMP1516]|uniref:PHD-type domain-containing protein n=2 Tax=Emiliania huxleyi TaxID=2903 RepID=A0A0D3KA95_EMIH1|nr:hypothetical protein EMIHUDRAFT_230450 [Emiliania huxleyi CCMP1516]EOD32680.1 hypothetical protein EMIHUDRAFT_230450 [Emiliania huxleyi CCMP1516]|eukprot:XP_005785109.1 hypothetical protein EMIHUDRAFT_230450 [Emiliania huxleyi CCMP1516]